MFVAPFFHNLIRKYVILVGTLFNNIRITQEDTDGNQTSLIKVPITYARKDKMLQRIFQDASIDRPSATMPLPCISFEYVTPVYDSERKLAPTGRYSVRDPNNANKFNYIYNPVPYDLKFKVYIYAKNTIDASKIIEQILPYFTPDWTTTCTIIPEMNITLDIPVVLDGVSYEDNYDDAFKKRRAIVYTLDLTLKGYFFGPEKDSNIIKFAKVNFYTPSVPDGKLHDAVGKTPVAERVTVQPGLTANGEPTSDITKTIPYREIDVNDDFGYITQIYNTDEIDD